MITEAFVEILLALLMIGLNVLINYLYSNNKLFPLLFMLFEILYCLQIIALSEIYVVFLLCFSVIYNILIIMDKKGEN